MKKQIKVTIDNPFKYGILPWVKYTDFLIRVPNEAFFTKTELKHAKKTKKS